MSAAVIVRALSFIAVYLLADINVSLALALSGPGPGFFGCRASMCCASLSSLLPVHMRRLPFAFFVHAIRAASSDYAISFATGTKLICACAREHLYIVNIVH